MKIIYVSIDEWKKIEREGRDNPHIRKKQELLNDLFLEFNDGHVKNFIEDNKFEPSDRHKYRLFLPPIEKTDCLPVLTFKWNHDGDKWDWKFILEVVKDQSHVLSFRFETQHSDGKTHSHLHMQINKDIFGPCEKNYQLNWIPKEHPHLLIRSDEHPNSPVILLVYLLGSLYGFKDARKFLDGTHPRYMKDMKNYFS
jgi:hypothetical protein